MLPPVTINTAALCAPRSAHEHRSPPHPLLCAPPSAHKHQSSPCPLASCASSQICTASLQRENQASAFKGTPHIPCLPELIPSLPRSQFLFILLKGPDPEIIRSPRLLSIVHKSSVSFRILPHQTHPVLSPRTTTPTLPRAQDPVVKESFSQSMFHRTLASRFTLRNKKFCGLNAFVKTLGYAEWKGTFSSSSCQSVHFVGIFCTYPRRKRVRT